MIRISNLKLEITKAKNNDTEAAALKNALLTKLKIKPNDLITFQIFKKSIDARKKSSIAYIYSVDASLKNEGAILKKCGKSGVIPSPDLSYQPVTPGNTTMGHRPVIIGLGPAGLFAGLNLARNGYAPIILERGDEVDIRSAKIDTFWQTGELDPDSNVQFGEGGAGTFSDGKLTTLINDPRCRSILEAFIAAGAPEEIRYLSKPHIGTDLLRETVKTLRKEIIANGGEVRFRSRVTDFLIEDDQLTGLIINEQETLNCQVALLGIGHSARDTFYTLHHRGVTMTPKAFSIGVRIEHPQNLINSAQYGQAAGTVGLGAADYKLSYHSPNGRSAYTFCMCPGGYVVAAASEANGVVTNGMSEHRRDGENANAALLVGVQPEDFGDSHPLAGVAFQRKWETLAFTLGGQNYHAPAQLVGDFLADRPSTHWGQLKPTYAPGLKLAQLKDCLPDYVVATMKEALVHFDQKMTGFAMDDSVMTGVETRSSSPVRINRNDDHVANISGLYPMGEGAGYAGGIMSSAVDGVKTAEKIIKRYAQLNPPK
ncbi:NAD(P)/FAD-dependent oxidoreductase [Acetobacterium carbinolicum]|uniref:NAD(P)/FAD-dependent oxidoreductase n=1 Tax=Acetobacterium carbinolicum TaxID=52690 RepID=UPI0039C99397